MRSPIKRSLLDVNEHFEGERKVAFKRGQRELDHFAERSNQKELNAKITLLDNFFLISNNIDATHFSSASPRSLIIQLPLCTMAIWYKQ